MLTGGKVTIFSLLLRHHYYYTPMKPIFLIGYMGSGKTTLGRALSLFMKKEFIDLDLYIEARFRHSVKEIFSQRGEEGFRTIERNMLHEAGEFEDVIIACGGGTPCHFDNMEFMNSKGVTVLLNASHEALMRRLTIPSAKSKRPIIADKTDDELSQFITDALKQRAEHYNQAKLHFDSSRLESHDQISESTKALYEAIVSHYDI